MSEKTFSRRYGSPYDRGSADRYYGRPYNPHYYRDDTYMSEAIPMERMTPEEISEYKAGWDEEMDRKEYR